MNKNTGLTTNPIGREFAGHFVFRAGQWHVSNQDDPCSVKLYFEQDSPALPDPIYPEEPNPFATVAALALEQIESELRPAMQILRGDSNDSRPEFPPILWRNHFKGELDDETIDCTLESARECIVSGFGYKYNERDLATSIRSLVARAVAQSRDSPAGSLPDAQSVYSEITRELGKSHCHNPETVAATLDAIKRLSSSAGISPEAPIQTRHMDEVDAANAGEKWLRQFIPGSVRMVRSEEPSGGQSPLVKWVVLIDRNDCITHGYMLKRDLMNWTQIIFIAAPNV
jgi:hypothetical protein